MSWSWDPKRICFFYKLISFVWSECGVYNNSLPNRIKVTLYYNLLYVYHIPDMQTITFDVSAHWDLLLTGLDQVGLIIIFLKKSNCDYLLHQSSKYTFQIIFSCLVTINIKHVFASAFIQGLMSKSDGSVKWIVLSVYITVTEKMDYILHCTFAAAYQSFL